MKYAIITDDTVAGLYGQTICRHFLGSDDEVELFAFPAGESSKTRQTKEQLEDLLLERGFSRDTTIVAVGGGVVTDLAGFLAATFCRGVNLILIPTTLLAMVDAAIGGKTGVNTPHGKNMIGSIYFPRTIIVHPGFLATLPKKEISCGTMEILKAGLIADAELFLNFEQLPLENAIARAIEVKRRIVALDPQEQGRRRLLNFGHTVGHALETVSTYQLSHGEAIAAGMVVEARISRAMGFLSEGALAEIEAHFPPVALPYDPEDIIQAMCLDKKSQGGTPRFVMLEEIGIPVEFEGEYCAEVSLNIVRKVIHDAALCTC